MNELSHAQRHELIAYCLKLAHWIAARYARRHPEMLDDLHGAALLALVRASHDFDPQRPDANWPGLARKIIERHLNAFLRREYTRQERFPVATSPKEGVAPVDELLTNDPDPETDAAAQELSVEVHRAVASLPTRQRTVIRLRYFGRDQRTLASVGRVLGISKQRVLQIQVAAFHRLRGFAAGTLLAPRASKTGTA